MKRRKFLIVLSALLGAGCRRVSACVRFGPYQHSQKVVY